MEDDVDIQTNTELDMNVINVNKNNADPDLSSFEQEFFQALNFSEQKQQNDMKPKEKIHIKGKCFCLAWCFRFFLIWTQNCCFASGLNELNYPRNFQRKISAFHPRIGKARWG